jgi:serine/threonine protein kinase
MEHEVVQTDADRYVIVEYIAEGGMGAIFLGKKVGMEGFEKEVVLKQLLPEFTSQPEFIDLFLREAKLSATLDHANIVHTIDLVAAGEDYFIVMEYVRGGDLRTIQRRIKQRGHTLSAPAALFIGREVLSALAYAHEKKGPDGAPLNLIHRDVSPSNIMVSGAGEVKLTDFGIAKVSTHKSVFYRVKGKVGYMSPEQAYADRPMDLRSDLYSVAVCLHEMLSGERLFVADLLSTPDQIYGQKVAKLEERPDIPAGIDDVMAKALAIDSDDRYQTALEFQDALVKVAYDNAMIFTAPDLASHLRLVCGENPKDWNTEDEEEQDDRPGTELLPGDVAEVGDIGDVPDVDVSSDQYSGVELTSVFTGLPEMLGPAPGGMPTPPADDSVSSAPQFSSADVAGDGATHHRGINPLGLAFEPTRLAGDIPKQNVAFDISDEYSDNEIITYPPAEQPPIPSVSPALHEAPTSPTQQLYQEHSGPGETDLLAEMSGVEPGMEEWTTGDEDDDDPTVALQNGVGKPPPAYAESVATDTPLPRTAAEAAAISGGHEALDSEATVELRVHRQREAQRQPELAHQVRRSRPPPQPEDPPLLTEVGFPEQRTKSQRHRLLLLVAAALLLLSGVAIVILVGLTGPNLDGGAKEPDQGSGMVSPGRDASSDQRAVTARPDLRAADLAPAKTTRALKVESAPPGARVYLDDVYQCRSPCTIEELEDDRIYLLSVRRERYVSWSSLIDMQGKNRVHINAYLSAEPDARKVGYLLLRSKPRADVYVDGKEIGRVTSEGRIPLPPGQYEITLHHPRRRRPWKRVVNIHARQIVALWPKF